MEDKKIWLNKYYPSIKQYLFIHQDIPKYKIILNYCDINNINLKDIIFVDDSLSILRETEKHGIESWHISSFLDIF